MQNVKNFVKRFIKKDVFIYKSIRKLYHILSGIKYKITNGKEIREKNKYYAIQVEKAVEKIRAYKNEKYIVLYNPTWLGVAASTKGLFENIIPLEQVFGKKNVNKIANAVVENKISSIILSQIVDGWLDIIKEIKRINPKIKIKVIWHGNCYEYFSDYTWSLNKEVMELYKEGKIDCFAFVRSIMYEFYQKTGFKSCYLQNNVHLEHIKRITKIENNKNKIGIYNADSRELKNIYTSLSAIKLMKNAIADVIPINKGAEKFAKTIELEIDSLENYISNEDLLERIQQNEINIYPTFTENAPMFPLESFELGIPCLLGNNNDYFVGTKLGEYVILNREDDPEYIQNKMLECIENKAEIIKLYQEWKEEFDEKCKGWVEDFIKV